MTPIELATLVAGRWRLLAALSFGSAVIAAGIAMVLPRTYAAGATFVVERRSATERLPAGLAGLAARFGVSVGSDAGTSPEFYAALVRSRTLLEDVLASRLADPRTAAPEDSVTVLDLLVVPGPDTALRLDRGYRRLRQRVSVGLDRQTGVVSLSVETRYPTLSADLANLLVDLVNRFNLEKRQTSARLQREFVDTRLASADQELRTAEDILQRFLARNRQWQQSSELQFEHDRLQRRVGLLQEVVTGLRIQYEEARIEEVNNTPVVTPVDRAVPPVRKSRPKRRVMVLTAAVLGGAAGLLIVLWREYVLRLRYTTLTDVDRLRGPLPSGSSVV
jgi:uncharacterized protein involved in exopolysaccharide biosynthesis